MTDVYMQKVSPYLNRARVLAKIVGASKEAEPMLPQQNIQELLAGGKESESKWFRRAFAHALAEETEASGENLYMKGFGMDEPIHPCAKYLVRLHLRQYNPLIVRTMLASLSSRVAWQQHGKKYYEVSPGLTEALAHTELRGLTSEDVRMPYENIYISVPRTTELELDLPLGRIPVTGIYLREIARADGERCLIFLVHSGENEGVITFSLTLSPGKKISEIVDDLRNAQKEEAQRAARMRASMGKAEAEYEDSSFDTQTWPKVVAWTLNLLMYLSTKDLEIEHGPHNKEFRDMQARLQKAKGTVRDSIKARLKCLDPDYRYRVGGSMRVSVVREEVAKREGSPLEVRTRVKGHWRHIVVGVGRQGRELRWILPFWRGSVGAPESNPIRLVT